MSRSKISKFSKIDPAHLLDGLFTPTAKKGEALYDVKGEFSGMEIKFEGVQMSVLHQSLLLAIAARTAQQPKGESVLVRGTADDVRSKQLVLLEITGKAESSDVSIVKCSAYALLNDAGMETGSFNYKTMLTLLHQMSTVTLYRGQGANGGTSRLLSFQHTGSEFTVSLNWRLTDAIFGGQNIQISLHERRDLSDSPVAKILHAWLSGFIRLGATLMAGRGADIDTLIKHVWGKRPCSDNVIKQRRMRIRDALSQINKLHGWTVRLEGTHAFISRPKELPMSGMHELPGDFIEYLDDIGPN